jgi:hypothetical protein
MTCKPPTEGHRMHDQRSPTRQRARLRWRVQLWLGAYLAVAGAVAHAQPAGPGAIADEVADEPGADREADADREAETTADMAARPWVEGIPIEVRLEANRIFLEGNELMREGLFLQATEKYQAALARWDHPGFHYNLAIAQINLDQPIAAYESLQRAVRHGAAPFGPDKLEQAQSFLTLLRNQLAQLAVSCDEPGAVVTMDGKPLFTGPGRARIMVLPGGHQLMADKAGRLPDTRQIVLSPGQRVRFSLAPRLPDYLVTERRWPAWRPWAVLGAGAVVMAAGGVVDWRAGVLFQRHDDEARRLCLSQAGCAAGDIPAELHRQLQRAERVQLASRAVYVVGGVMLSGGAVLLYLNRERPVRRRGRVESPSVSVLPLLAPHVTGLSASVSF